jgi:enoyl-CoA hydratase/carnithine racemase
MPSAARPASLQFERHGEIGVLALNRPAKRNALSDTMIAELHAFFSAPPAAVRALVLHGLGEHFCAGLDLSQLESHSASEAMAHSRGWHDAFARIQFGKVPVVAVLHGAVVGGGLELACSAHVRVAETSTFYALPEGQRGLFTGGGASVRVPRIIGATRMADMMLTGRVLSAEEGQVIGLSSYIEPPGAGLARGMELARKIAQNAPFTNFAVMHALPRIAEMGQDAGLFTEALVAGIAAAEPEAQQRMQNFLKKRAGKVSRT